MSARRPSFYVVLCAGVILVGFTASGHLRVDRTARPSRPDEPVVIRPDRPARPPAAPVAQLHGSVWDALGFRIVGAEIAPANGERVRTDADGRFVLPLASPTSDLVVQATGQRSVIARAFAMQPDPLVLALEPAAPWDPPLMPAPELPAHMLYGEGLVTDQDGKAVANAIVTVSETGEIARTDELGRYRVALPAHAASLICQVDGGGDGTGASGRAEPFTPPRDRGLVPLPDLVVQQAALLRGTVRDPKGQPIAGLPLRVTGNGFQRFVTSSENGAFRVPGLPTGRYELFAFAWRGACGGAQDVDIADHVVDCEVRLHPVSSRRVQVVQEDGAPVPRAFVASTFAGLRRGVAQTDAQGFAELPTVDEPEFEVRADAEWRPMAIRRFEKEPARLVVAAP